MDSCTLINLREDHVLGTNYFHFRAAVDVTKPLPRILKVSLPDGVSHVGLLKYERIPTFCFLRGAIGHRYHMCSEGADGDLEVTTMPYGSWMGGVDNIISDFLFTYDVNAEYIYRKHTVTSSKDSFSK